MINQLSRQVVLSGRNISNIMPSFPSCTKLSSLSTFQLFIRCRMLSLHLCLCGRRFRHAICWVQRPKRNIDGIDKKVTLIFVCLFWSGSLCPCNGVRFVRLPKWSKSWPHKYPIAFEIKDLRFSFVLRAQRETFWRPGTLKNLSGNGTLVDQKKAPSVVS